VVKIAGLGPAADVPRTGRCGDAMRERNRLDGQAPRLINIPPTPR
jgi:hypothetical protein